MVEEFITKSAEETKEVGEQFVRGLMQKERLQEKALVIAMDGHLGGGKTTFIQGMAKGLDIAEKITSPSFVLIKKYGIWSSQSSFKNFYHIDCYRFEKSWELQELEFEKIANDPKNLVVVEWAERATIVLPESAIRVNFEYLSESERKITITS